MTCSRCCFGLSLGGVWKDLVGLGSLTFVRGMLFRCFHDNQLTFVICQFIFCNQGIGLVCSVFDEALIELSDVNQLVVHCAADAGRGVVGSVLWSCLLAMPSSPPAFGAPLTSAEPLRSPYIRVLWADLGHHLKTNRLPRSSLWGLWKMTYWFRDLTVSGASDVAEKRATYYYIRVRFYFITYAADFPLV